MAVLFIASASVQFNDQDWYFWIPLYGCAAYVHLVSCWSRLPLTAVRGISKVALCQGQILLSKVLLEYDFRDIAGMLSLDMRDRVVREKFGCVLVIISMILQLSALEWFHQDHSRRKNMQVPESIIYGTLILVGISYGLSLVFLMYPEEEIKL